MKLADHLRRNQPEVYRQLMDFCGWPDLREPTEEELAGMKRLMEEKPGGKDGK